MSKREVRPAPAPGIFDSRRIPQTRADILPDCIWWRLYQKAYANQFYPSKGSRLTPSSWTFPCVYLADAPRTTVGEVWGDRFALAQANGKAVFSITKKEANAYAFLRLDALPGDLLLCDLTDEATLDAVGIDLGTLYSTDLAVTQAWAERIALHPSKFNGIAYNSRHTNELCIVLWDRNERNVSAELNFSSDGDFIYSKPAYECAAAKGLKLAFT